MIKWRFWRKERQTRGYRPDPRMVGPYLPLTLPPEGYIAVVIPDEVKERYLRQLGQFQAEFRWMAHSRNCDRRRDSMPEFDLSGLFVSDGISQGRSWGTYRRQPNGSYSRVHSRHRLPDRATAAEAHGTGGVESTSDVRAICPGSSGEGVRASEGLTGEQLANWRRVLVGMLGPYALLMTEAEIQAFRDRFQAHADALGLGNVEVAQ